MSFLSYAKRRGENGSFNEQLVAAAIHSAHGRANGRRAGYIKCMPPEAFDMLLEHVEANRLTTIGDVALYLKGDRHIVLEDPK